MRDTLVNFVSTTSTNLLMFSSIYVVGNLVDASDTMKHRLDF